MPPQFWTLENSPNEIGIKEEQSKSPEQKRQEEQLRLLHTKFHQALERLQQPPFPANINIEIQYSNLLTPAEIDQIRSDELTRCEDTENLTYSPDPDEGPAYSKLRQILAKIEQKICHSSEITGEEIDPEADFINTQITTPQYLLSRKDTWKRNPTLTQTRQLALYLQTDEDNLYCFLSPVHPEEIDPPTEKESIVSFSKGFIQESLTQAQKLATEKDPVLAQEKISQIQADLDQQVLAFLSRQNYLPLRIDYLYRELSEKYAAMAINQGQLASQIEQTTMNLSHLTNQAQTLVKEVRHLAPQEMRGKLTEKGQMTVKEWLETQQPLLQQKLITQDNSRRWFHQIIKHYALSFSGRTEISVASDLQFAIDRQENKQVAEIIPGLNLIRGETENNQPAYLIHLGTEGHSASTEDYQPAPALDYESHLDPHNSLEQDAQIASEIKETLEEKFGAEFVHYKVEEIGSFHETFLYSTLFLNQASLQEISQKQNIPLSAVLSEIIQLIRDKIAEEE